MAAVSGSAKTMRRGLQRSIFSFCTSWGRITRLGGSTLARPKSGAVPIAMPILVAGHDFQAIRQRFEFPRQEDKLLGARLAITLPVNRCEGFDHETPS